MTAAIARQGAFERDALKPFECVRVHPQRAEPAPGAGASLAALRAADLSAAPVASPARTLQEELQDQLHHALEDEPIESRWSSRRTAAFLVVTCGSFWTGVAVLIHQIL